MEEHWNLSQPVQQIIIFAPLSVTNQYSTGWVNSEMVTFLLGLSTMHMTKKICFYSINWLVTTFNNWIYPGLILDLTIYCHVICLPVSCLLYRNWPTFCQSICTGNCPLRVIIRCSETCLVLVKTFRKWRDNV